MSLDLALLICLGKFASLQHGQMLWASSDTVCFICRWGWVNISRGAGRAHASSCQSGMLEILVRVWFKVYRQPVFSQRPAWGLSQPWQAQGQILLPQSGIGLWNISP